MGIRCAVTILSMLCALPAAAQMRAFTGATIIDGNGGKPITNGVVLIDGRKIKAVGASGSISIPKDAERIDVSGKYIVPAAIPSAVGDAPGYVNRAQLGDPSDVERSHGCSRLQIWF